jgi:hypothetical protein
MSDKAELQIRTSKAKLAEELLKHPILTEYFQTMEQELCRRVWDLPLSDKQLFMDGVLTVKEQVEGAKMFRDYLEGIVGDGKMANYELNQGNSV